MGIFKLVYRREDLRRLLKSQILDLVQLIVHVLHLAEADDTDHEKRHRNESDAYLKLPPDTIAESGDNPG